MISCDQCGSSELHYVGQTFDGNSVYECLNCGLLFVQGISENPEPQMDEIIERFDNNY